MALEPQLRRLPPVQDSGCTPALRAALTKALAGATWQRCRVHPGLTRQGFMRNLLAYVPRGDKAMVAAAVRTIFGQPNHQAARQQLAEVVKAMHPCWPKAAELPATAEEDVLAYKDFLQDHWTRIYSTNILERLIREIRRRTNVVGVFPDDPSVVRPLGTQVIEIAEDRELERRFLSQESMQRLTHPEQVLVAEPMPPRLAPVRRRASVHLFTHAEAPAKPAPSAETLTPNWAGDVRYRRREVDCMGWRSPDGATQLTTPQTVIDTRV